MLNAERAEAMRGIAHREKEKFPGTVKIEPASR
jgi:hypothetical protein